MIKKVFNFFIYFILVIIPFSIGYLIIYLDSNSKENYANKKLEYQKKDIDDIYTKVIDSYQKTITNKENYLYIVEANMYFKEKSISKKFNSMYDDYIHFLNFSKFKNINVIALGTDNSFHISNYFLEGFAPYKTSEIWTPLSVIASKKTYQYDQLGSLHKKEVWQKSSEAFSLPRGDCEDHAIIIADWLIENGEDARVVLGEFKNNGHAWVVLFKDNNEYIIEATQKTNILKAFIPTTMALKYKPIAMFNQKHYWYNIGNKNTTNYHSKNWIKKSLYLKSSPLHN
ncbi:MAG: hypothetical protein C0625_01935 [Arcobacter sp.]|nr:MAG: hypothetical protein C0625_01935 [Arcobacter sp.]